MLRLSRDRISIAFCPDRLAGVRTGGLLRPQVLEKRSIECDSGHGPQLWHGALHALRGVAASLKDDAADVTVVLSNHFVRFSLVPWSGELRHAGDELAMARYCFAKVHGERASQWELRLSRDVAGAPRLASAIDKDLMDSLLGCFKQGGKTRLVSVQPYLMAAFNVWRKEIHRDDTWLLLIEPERACIAHIRQGKWSMIRNTKVEITDARSLLEFLERERSVTEAANESGRVLVSFAGNPKMALPQSNGWSFTNLVLPVRPGISPAGDERYAMALCGSW